MRTVKAEIIIDQVWLEVFLSDNRDHRISIIDYAEVKIYSSDKEQIIDILEQIYRQDLEQQ